MDDSTNQDGAGNPQRLRGSYYGIKGQEKKYFRHAIQSWATNLVLQATKSGELVRPEACEECKSKRMRPHAHHDDYLKPLEVRWLCSSCHKRWHAWEGPGKNLTAPVPTQPRRSPLTRPTGTFVWRGKRRPR